MGKLRRLSGKEVCQTLADHGFAEVRRRGSHIIMQKSGEAYTITVPVPDHKEIRPGTMSSIIRQSGLLRSGFDKVEEIPYDSWLAGEAGRLWLLKKESKY